MFLQKIKHTSLALLVFVLVVGGVVFFFMLRPVPVVGEVPKASVLQAGKFVPPPPPTNITVIAARPLFWHGRKPYVEPEPEPEPIAKPQNNALDSVEVLGLFQSGAASSVVLKDKSGTSRISMGEGYKGWHLIEVLPRSAIFARAGGNRSEASETKEVRINHREPLPAQWQGKHKNLSEK
ncbi:hypothetical protein [uncultured Gilvimarinus sp.]|uniref:hypothetical protein n=1 Tax=uncultured Gilvimarinus sp. TaxID=1689143 RepID=UPI0030DC39BE